MFVILNYNNCLSLKFGAANLAYQKIYKAVNLWGFTVFGGHSLLCLEQETCMACASGPKHAGS